MSVDAHRPIKGTLAMSDGLAEWETCRTAV